MEIIYLIAGFLGVCAAGVLLGVAASYFIFTPIASLIFDFLYGKGDRRG